MHEISFTVRVSLILVLITGNASGAINDPFPSGISMATFGTILKRDGATGRQPWIPVCSVTDTVKYGLACSYINFYGAPGSWGNEGIGQLAIGGIFLSRYLALKVGFLYLSALSIYNEEKLYISAGSSIIPLVKGSVEVEGIRAGLNRIDKPSHRGLSAGISFAVQTSNSMLVAGIERCIRIYQDMEGFLPPASLSFGIHSSTPRGSVGAVIVKEISTFRPISVTLGEEIALVGGFFLHAAYSFEPSMVGVGFSFNTPHSANALGLVHHRVMGFSQGIYSEYTK